MLQVMADKCRALQHLSLELRHPLPEAVHQSFVRHNKQSLQHLHFGAYGWAYLPNLVLLNMQMHCPNLTSVDWVVVRRAAEWAKALPTRWTKLQSIRVERHNQETGTAIILSGKRQTFEFGL